MAVALAGGLPLFGQYSGPAILSRGEAPAALTMPNIRFRPYAEVDAIYDTGLAAVALTAGNQLANTASFGYGVNFGVSGSHTWKRSYLGLQYSGAISQYRSGSTVPRSVSQSVMMGFNYRISRHTRLSLRNTAGFFTRNYSTAGLAETVPFDPSQSYVPTTDFFDNRTIFATTQADLTIERSARTSISLGGDGFINKRRSKALASTSGATARADYEYRVTRSTTIGANYTYGHYTFTDVVGGSDMHGVAAVYSVRPSRWLEFSGYGGMMRIESTFLRVVAVDPVIAQLLGVSQSTQIYHNIYYTPNFAARLSRRLPHGVAYLSGGRSIIPGNGLFLTSVANYLGAGYTYTGLRRWSFASQAAMSRADAQGTITGQYNAYTGGVSASRTLGRSIYLSFRYSIRQYASGDYQNYNRLIYDASVGVGFTPGDLPLRLW